MLSHEVGWCLGLYPKLNPFLNLLAFHQAGDLAHFVKGGVGTTNNYDINWFGSFWAGCQDC